MSDTASQHLVSSTAEGERYGRPRVHRFDGAAWLPSRLAELVPGDLARVDFGGNPMEGRVTGDPWPNARGGTSLGVVFILADAPAIVKGSPQ